MASNGKVNAEHEVRFCTGGSKWLVVTGTDGCVYKCHTWMTSGKAFTDANHGPITLLGSNPCSLYCPNPCDHDNVVTGVTPERVERVMETRILFYTNWTCPNRCTYCNIEMVSTTNLSMEQAKNVMAR